MRRVGEPCRGLTRRGLIGRLLHEELPFMADLIALLMGLGIILGMVAYVHLCERI